MIQLDADEENADLLNDEIYHRYLRMEDTYNCLISETRFDDLPTTYKSMIRSGDDAYDIGMIYDNAIADMGMQENLYDLVRDGKWTLDAYNAIAEQSVIDLNGDGVYDDKDQYSSAGAIKL